MKLYLVEYDDGGAYEQNMKEVVGIFESLEKATEFITSYGFINVESNDYFVRQHDDIKGECCAHKDYASIYIFDLNIPTGDYLDCFTHHYKKRVPRGNPYNVLNNNHFVKVYCSHCKNYILDLNTLFKGNLVSSKCSTCGEVNYPHSWIEIPITKNEKHADNTAVYFDEES